MFPLYAFLATWLLISKTNKYPVWTSPGSWNGTYNFPAVNASGTLLFCYDGENLKFAKHFSQPNSTFGLIFYNNTQYDICYGP